MDQSNLIEFYINEQNLFVHYLLDFILVSKFDYMERRKSFLINIGSHLLHYSLMDTINFE